MVQWYMATVDGISTKINEKIGIINDLISAIRMVCVLDKDMTIFQKTIEGFEFGSLQILSDYYFLKDESIDEKKKKSELLNKYVRFIVQENIISQLNCMYLYLRTVILKLQLKTSVITKLFLKYEETKLKIAFKETRGYLCTFCDEQMSFIAKESTLECSKCFAQQDARGMMYSEDQADISEKNYKSNQYQARKHGKAWIDCLQGLESKEIPEKVLVHIKECMRKDRIIDVSKVTCNTIRGYLSKKSNMSKYNQHIPKIRKLVTGIEPPQLTEAESELFFEYYGKVINIYNTIKEKVNCPYCPYFIYKILEQILKDPIHHERKGRFFSYIHLQLSNTLNDQDKLWKSICKDIPEFAYRPTIRNL